MPTATPVGTRTARATVTAATQVVRLGGDCAHVPSESVDSKREAVKGDAWLHGRFTYVR